MTAILAMQQSLSIQVSADIAKRVAEAMQAATRGAAIGAFQSIGTLLAVRLLLMLALIGGFAVALLVLRLGTYQADAVFVAYAVLVVIPLIWLERNPRVGG